MKYVMVGILVFFLAAIPVQAGNLTMNAGIHDASGELITVKAQGLVCEFCAKALEKVFMKRPEVSGIKVDLSTKEVLISLKSGQTLDNKTVDELITHSGYNVEDIIRTPPK